MGVRRLSHVLAGFGIVSLGAVVPSAPAAAEPSIAFKTVSPCPPENPYTVDPIVSGFPRDRDIWSAYVVEGGHQAFVITFKTDSNGSYVFSRIEGPEPFSLGINFYSDDNGNQDHEPDEALLLAVRVINDRPCQDATVNPK